MLQSNLITSTYTVCHPVKQSSAERIHQPSSYSVMLYVIDCCLLAVFIGVLLLLLLQVPSELGRHPEFRGADPPVPPPPPSPLPAGHSDG